MWVYWVVLILFTSLGGFITWVFLHIMVRDSWVAHRQRKIEKNSKVKRFKPKKAKEGFFSYIFGIILMAVVFGGLPFFCFYVAFPTWLDLPIVITGNYAEKTGVLTKFVETEFSGRRSWGYPYYLYLDHVFYNSIEPIYVQEGETIMIEYLPNTKVVVGYIYK